MHIKSGHAYNVSNSKVKAFAKMHFSYSSVTSVKSFQNTSFFLPSQHLSFPRCVWTQHDAACGGSLHYLATGVAADRREGIPGIFLRQSQLNTDAKQVKTAGELDPAPPIYSVSSSNFISLSCNLIRDHNFQLKRDGDGSFFSVGVSSANAS